MGSCPDTDIDPNYLPRAKQKIQDQGNFTKHGIKYQFWRNKVFSRPPPREDRWECELHPSLQTHTYMMIDSVRQGL